MSARAQSGQGPTGLCGASEANYHLGPNGRGFDLHPPRPPHQEKLQIDELGCAEVGHLRADAGEAVAQPPFERPQALPLQAVQRVSGRVRLRYDAAGEALAPVVVVALGAGEVELALAAMEGFPAGLEKRLAPRVDQDADRQAARLPRHVRGEREQLLALIGERRRLLPPGPAEVDSLLEAHRAGARAVESGIARRDALHARARIAVAIRARAPRGARFPVP